jgi:two-component system chemotaxis response regulator CheY
VKILIADDDAISRRLTEATLRGAGYEVTTVGDGRQAWEALGQGGYDLAVLDWMMPEMDGVALCRRFHRQLADDYLYIILLTSRGEQEDIVKGLDAGADEYLVKPFEPQELRARVRAAARVVGLERRLMRANERLQRLASTDELTGMMNRRATLDRLLDEAGHSAQAGGKLTVVMMDVDGFKLVNDRFGHAAGDAVLEGFSRRVRASLPEEDSLGRLGGDEFLAVLPGAGEEEGVRVGRLIVERVSCEPFEAECEEGLRITVSVGVAEVDPRARVETMLSLADKALYDAKRRGGGRVCAVSGIRERAEAAG